MSAQLTPGQKCLLDLLQRKLLNTIQSYAKLSSDKQQSDNYCPDIENELFRLKEKIRRISARQKRFTLEIINGNGNNTIPKETFFEALGLVTKEALSKLSSKTNERRRRTTANPRFSHEAIQARRALEPRVSRDKRVASQKKPQPRPADHDFGYLQKEVNAKKQSVNIKRQSNKKLQEYNEEIRRRGLEIMNALANFDQDRNEPQAQTNDTPSLQSNDPMDVWIDLKCEESLDGLD